jgi:hypothetical protein
LRQSHTRYTLLGFGTLLFSFVALAACNGIIGTRDVVYDSDASTPRNDGSIVVVPPDGSAPASDGAVVMCTPSPSFDTDAKNCGRCGHDCFGGVCSAGKCGKVELSAPARVDEIVLDGNDLYMASTSPSGGVHKVPLSVGGTSGLVAPCSYCQGLAVDATSVFFGGLSDGDNPQTCAKGGCAAASNLGTSTYLKKIVLLGGRMIIGSDDGVQLVEKTGGGAVILDSTTRVFDLATDGVFVYYTNYTNSVYRVRVSGGAREKVGDHIGDRTDTRALAVAAGRVYWTDTNLTSEGKVFGVGTDLSIMRVEYAPGKVGLVPSAIGADGTHVYWATVGAAAGQGGLYRCPIAGCAAPTVIVDGLVGPRTLLVTNDSIFVGHENGVFRIAKP